MKKPHCQSNKNFPHQSALLTATFGEDQKTILTELTTTIQLKRSLHLGKKGFV